MSGIAPGLDGFLAQRQMAGREQNQQLGQMQGLLGIQQAMSQQQEAQRIGGLKGLLGKAYADGDQDAVRGILAQIDPVGAAKRMLPQPPKWNVSERFNPQTGRQEKVLVDMNNPQNVQPFGGQKAPTMTAGADGVVRDMSSVQPGTVINDPSKLVITGPNGPMVNPTALDAKRQVAAAGAGRTTTIVNPALDPFKNEKSLRDEFKNNPVVKNADEMGGAFRLIETAYKNPSPANDLAMATKYMKVLDPTSVVRESELALAMGAVGLLDKVYNYANLVASGQKLTPTQRKDFYDSAKAINEEFQKGKSGVASQYKGIAQQYKLSPQNVTLERETDGWSIQKVD